MRQLHKAMSLEKAALEEKLEKVQKGAMQDAMAATVKQRGNALKQKDQEIRSLQQTTNMAEKARNSRQIRGRCCMFRVRATNGSDLTQLHSNHTLLLSVSRLRAKPNQSNSVFATIAHFYRYRSTQEQERLAALAHTLDQELSEALAARRDAMAAKSLAEQRTAVETARAADAEAKLESAQHAMKKARELSEEELRLSQHWLNQMNESGRKKDQERIQQLEEELQTFRMHQASHAMSSEDWSRELTAKAQKFDDSDDDMNYCDEASTMKPPQPVAGRKPKCPSVAGSRASWFTTVSTDSNKKGSKPRCKIVKANWNAVCEGSKLGDKKLAAREFIMKALEQHFSVDIGVVQQLSHGKPRTDRQALNRKVRVYEAYGAVAQLMVHGEIVDGKKKNIKIKKRKQLI
jgi:hypothetical protein